MSSSVILQAGLLVWVALLAALIAGRIARGHISTRGMLVENPRKSGVDPERVVAMAVFPSVIAFYVIHTLNSGVVWNGNMPIMPDVPESLLVALTGGNGFYLAGKLARGRGGKRR